MGASEKAMVEMASQWCAAASKNRKDCTQLSPSCNTHIQQVRRMRNN